MDGLVYILDQTGRALAQAQQRIEALTADNAAQRSAVAQLCDLVDALTALGTHSVPQDEIDALCARAAEALARYKS